MKLVRGIQLIIVVLNVLSAISLISDVNGQGYGYGALENNWVVMKSTMASLNTFAYSLGWLMLCIMGVRWIVAENASERGDAKKGMIYIMVALLILSVLCSLMCLYCKAATDSLSAGGVNYFDCRINEVGCGACS